jgi:hypothetical protein
MYSVGHSNYLFIVNFDDFIGEVEIFEDALSIALFPPGLLQSGWRIETREVAEGTESCI